jgi:hypothetical protein
MKTATRFALCIPLLLTGGVALAENPPLEDKVRQVNRQIDAVSRELKRSPGEKSGPYCANCGGTQAAAARGRAPGGDTQPASPIPLFQSDELIEVEMKSDFPNVVGPEANFQDPKPADGTLVFGTGDKRIELKVRYEARGGHTRGQGCSFKPIKIRYDKASIAGTPLANSTDNDMKFVTHCSGLGAIDPASETSQAVLREYLAYRVLHEMGFRSLIPRLAKVTYRNDKGEIVAQTFGFFVETKKDAGKRYGDLKPADKVVEYDQDLAAKQAKAAQAGKGAPTAAVLHDDALPGVYDEFKLAQSLLGNMDYHLDTGHNSSLLYNKDAKVAAALPFDFDRSMAYGTATFNDIVGQASGEWGKRITDAVVANKQRLLTLPDRVPLDEAHRNAARESLGKIVESAAKRAGKP